jgi:hypothetical protein
MTATVNASMFTPQEIARARKLRAADPKLQKRPLNAIAGLIRRHIPREAYEGPHGAR